MQVSRFTRLFLGLHLLLSGCLALSQECDPGTQAQDTDRWEIHDDETVTDRRTGLTWTRCHVGGRWTGEFCARGWSFATWSNWSGALKTAAESTHAGFDDWRVPSVRELLSLVHASCRQPSIDEYAFPLTPQGNFWTSTEFTKNPNYVWRVNFGTGQVVAELKTVSVFYLRLVRGEPLVAPAATAGNDAGKSRETINRRDDGIHDMDAPATHLLQDPNDIYETLVLTDRGTIDWVKSLDRGLIHPRQSLDGSERHDSFGLKIIMRQTKEMPHVLFDHRIHTEWLTCSNCHPSIFIPQAGANRITMGEILGGRFCGQCHGRVAFSIYDCERCHQIPHENSPAAWWKREGDKAPPSP